jgi:hypothetical protein
MESNYKSLLSRVCAIVLGYKRLNDVELNDDTYTIQFKDVTDNAGVVETKLFLRNNKQDDYGVTERQLAALRIATGPITAKWFDEFKEEANGTTLQVKAREMLEAGTDLATAKFQVVAQLKVKNEFVTNSVVPVYQDRCYEGISAYRTGLRELTKGKTGKFWESTEYSYGVRDLREKLHSTAVKTGKTIEANEVKLPVFKLV